MPDKSSSFSIRVVFCTSLQVRFLPLLLLVLLPTWVSAQITGRVLDSQGNSIEGVDITALHDGATTVSGADGSFSLELLDDPVEIQVQGTQELGTLGTNPLPVPGTRLEMNLQSGQMELHTQSGVFDLQGKFLRVAQDADVYSHAEKGSLRKTLAQADSLVFVKAGYLTKWVEITDDAEDLGDVAMRAYGSLTDSRDGQVYATVTIGNQTWMAENLNYSGDDGAGNKTFDIGWCYGVGETDTTNHADSTTCDTYGRLYTWAMLMDGTASSDANPSAVQGICPDGWHVPSDAEWTELTDTVIANSAATSTSDISSYLKAVSAWANTGNGTDTFGFSALPGGSRGSITHFFSAQGYQGRWWSASELNSINVWYRYMVNHDDFVNRSFSDKNYGYSLRCLED